MCGFSSEITRKDRGKGRKSQIRSGARTSETVHTEQNSEEVRNVPTNHAHTHTEEETKSWPLNALQ